MTNNLAPIVVFAYNRPDHLQQTLQALAKNDLASESVLYVYCDGAKTDATPEQIQKVAENRAIAKAAIGFKELHVIEREKNIGLKDNIIGAVTEIVNQYGRVITLEDDIVTSKGFLRYMNDALEVYKDDEKVMHISGFTWPHKWHLPETFFYTVPYPGGGWATWQRAWKYYNDNTEELYNYWKTRWDEFNRYGGTFLQAQLEKNMLGQMRTWFVKWYAVMAKMGGLALYPTKSMTNNIGWDDSGTNCQTCNKYFIAHPLESVKVIHKPIKESRLAANEVYAFFQGRWYNKRRRQALLNNILHFLRLR